MTDVDALIIDAMDRADMFAGKADAAISAISRVHHDELTSNLTIQTAEKNQKYTKPDKDTTPKPEWQDPPGEFPTVSDPPGLPEVNPLDLPSAPYLALDGLFNTPRPSTDLPTWDESAPEMNVDDIYNEMKAVAFPVLQDIALPTITPLSIDPPPGLVLPEYEAALTPEAIPAPIDYAAFAERKYNKLTPEIRNVVDDIMQRWMQRFAPEFEEQRSLLNSKLVSAMNSTVLPDEIESAMYSRARTRVEEEYTKAENEVFETQKSRGFVVPPSAVTSAMSQARLAGAGALATQATEIYIERKKMEVQHLQFVLNLVGQQLTAVRDLAVRFAETGLGVVAQAFSAADKFTANAITMFEHQRSRHEFQLALMKALNDQYEVRLKVALSGLEGYKLELQALETRANVEKLQVDTARLAVETQQLLVQRYSAIIDAIAKRMEGDRLKVERFKVLAEVFKVGLDARVATFEVYKAALEGDKAKVQGEIAKVTAYEAEIKGAEAILQAEVANLEAGVKRQDAHFKTFNSQADAYKTGVQVAVERFRAEAEAKKLGLEVYQTEMKSNLTEFEIDFERFKFETQRNIEQFKGDLALRMAEIDMAVRQDDFDLRKLTSIADGYSNMASAALQSLNSTVASTTSA